MFVSRYAVYDATYIVCDMAERLPAQAGRCALDSAGG